MKIFLLTVGTKNESTRIKWVKKNLKKIPKGSKILDAGAGEQQFKKFCSHLKYTSQDFAQYEGKGDRRGLQRGTWEYGKLDIISDITSIPRLDESFDAILCTEVFEHLSDPLSALKEFSRLLKKEGYLIITAPFCSLTHFSPYHFYTGFNRYFYETHLPKLGFKIIESKANGNYFEYLAQEIRRIPEVLRMYTKQKQNISYFFARLILLKFLDKLSKNDKGSSELLNFGYHVFARKIE